MSPKENYSLTAESFTFFQSASINSFVFLIFYQHLTKGVGTGNTTKMGKVMGFGRESNDTPLQYSCLDNPMDRGAWWAAVHGVIKSQTRLSDFTFTFHFHTLEKKMATHSSVLAWRIPGMGEPGGLPSLGLHRVGHDWSDLAAWDLEPDWLEFYFWLFLSGVWIGHWAPLSLSFFTYKMR